MDGLEQVTAALNQSDYRRAAKLLKPLLKQNADHPQIQLYAGNVYEGIGNIEKAEAVYRKLLKKTTNPKWMRLARQGLDRLQQASKERREQAIAQANDDPNNEGNGFLLIAPIPAEQKSEAARRFAQIMNIDPYTARIQLPSRAWKLYRIGSMAALSVYGNELKDAGITTFSLSIEQIKHVQVFQVSYIESMDAQVKIVCHNSDGQLGEISFRWPEATQSVTGSLPIFEDVVDLGAYNKLKRTEKTQDYTQIHDLHLPERKCVLRFCDRTYQFTQGIDIDGLEHPELPQVHATTRLRWNALSTNLMDKVKLAPTWTDFTGFGPTAFDHLDLMDGFDPNIHLFRKAETKWDHAFHLYSCAAFWHTAQLLVR